MCLLALVGFRVAAQDDKPLREVYQANAMGQGTQLGRTFSVTVNIERYSTPEERQVLVDAFNKAGSQGLYNALGKMQSKGRLADTGTLGYDISFVRKIPTPRLHDPHPDQSPDPIRRGLGEWTVDGLQPLVRGTECQRPKR